MTKTTEMPELVMKPIGYVLKDRIVRYAEHNWSILESEHFLGDICGVEIYAGIDYPINPELILDPKNPLHINHFKDYSKQEKARFIEWNRGIYGPYYRGRKGLHEKQKWGFVNISVMAFVNGIQLGESQTIGVAVETGYAPSLNQFDIGDPVFLDEKETIRNWAINNTSAVLDFANVKRAEAIKLINDTQKKLG